MDALAEPLTVGVHTSILASKKLGESVKIFGARPVGIAAASAASTFGAIHEMIVDIFDNKLELAQSMGSVTHTFNSKTKSTSKDSIQGLVVLSRPIEYTTLYSLRYFPACHSLSKECIKFQMNSLAKEICRDFILIKDGTVFSHLIEIFPY